MELVVILAVLMLLFGASQLPKLARSIGESARELRSGFESDPGHDPDRGAGD